MHSACRHAAACAKGMVINRMGYKELYMISDPSARSDDCTTREEVVAQHLLNVVGVSGICKVFSGGCIDV